MKNTIHKTHRRIKSPRELIIVGENIHATRVLRRSGTRVGILDNGQEAISYNYSSGEQQHLIIPEWFKNTQPYKQGQIKHFLIAMRKGISGDPKEEEEGARYIQHEVRRQVAAGANYLDINVDEVDYKLEVQKQCMKWVIKTVQEVSQVPPSIDSSIPEIIAHGLKAYDQKAGRPLINSVALERIETLDLVEKHNARIIVMATSSTGMPEDSEQRIHNAGTIINHVQSRNIALDDVFVDAIVFPIAVDSQNGNRYLDAVRTIRNTFGNEIHIGMGLSNVSFGMPNRKLINETFIKLALEAGADSGLIDPIQTNLDKVFNINFDDEPTKLAMDMLLGQDPFCLNYIKAFRSGKLR